MALPRHSTAVLDRQPSAAPAPALHIHVLGGLRVTVAGTPVPTLAWQRRKAQNLVKLLALAPGHALHREEVLEQLWPELEPEAATNNLHQSLHAARRALGPAARALQFQGERLVLCPVGPLWIDVAAFEAAAAAALTGADPAAYERALELYSGELLPEDRYEDWAAERREALRTTCRRLLTRLAALYEARGEPAAAITALERVVAAEPAHEEAHTGLMRLYAGTGQRAQALRQYGHLREALQRELDAEPDAAVQRLYQQILAGELAPDHGGAVSRCVAVGPPSTPPPAPHLPIPLTRFIGREREVGEVTGLLGGTRLLTLTGAGGSGKTRLALAVARALAEGPDYPDGVWLVELAPIADPELVPAAVATAVQVCEQPGRSLTDCLIGALRNQTVVLVLDNCEHLIDACALLAERLLSACPGLRILATSREALRVPGEMPWLVPALGLPAAATDPEHLPPLTELEQTAAVALFIDRVRLLRPGFALTPANAPTVIEICRRLDGIPLALELAAARAAVLSVEQLAARLDDALRLLVGGSRTAPTRQQTLRATLDWSYGLLEEPERTVLRRLAVFAGGWTVEAAEAVCVGAGGWGRRTGGRRGRRRHALAGQP